MFSNTVSLAKMLVRRNERPIPMRQIRCGGAPVMSRPANITRPLSGRRCPVIRLKKVVLPAPLGPITATIWRSATSRLTPPTATKPAKLLCSSRTSSIAARYDPLQTRHSGHHPADQPAGKHKQQNEEQAAEHKRPILGVVGDLLVEPNKRRRPDRRPPEVIHAAEDRHDDDLGRFRPEYVIGKDAAAEDAVESPGQTGKTAGHDKRGKLVGAHIKADKGGAFGVVADRRQHAAKRRAHDPMQDRQR